MNGLELAITGIGEDAAAVRVALAPPGMLVTGQGHPLSLDEIPFTGPAPVQAAGEELFQRLGANAEVAQALTQLCAALPADQVHPVYLRIDDELAAAMPWEMLRVAGQYLALEQSFPIARISAPLNRLDQRDYPLSAEVRVLALLSALNRPAAEEWDALYAAASAARDGGLEVRMLVLASEEDLEATVQGRVDAGDGWIEVRTVPPNVAQLTQAVVDFHPNLLHVYAHGSVHGTVRRLHLAARNDWPLEPAAADNTSVGSVNVGLANLAAAALRGNVWMVVLNACQGGAGNAEVYSFASDLVRSGLPAAIGHREPVHVNDAHRFCGALYPRVFAMMSEALAAGGDREIEWAEALYDPRNELNALHGGQPDVSKEWSLPILYVREQPFVVRVVADVVDVDAAAADLGVEDTFENVADLLAGYDEAGGFLARIPQ